MEPPLRWFIASTACGSLADGIATTALPLVLIGLTTQPVLVALLTVALGLPWLAFSLHAGVLADRTDRRTILWAATAMRALIAALLVALVVTGLVSVAALLALALLEGTATVIFRAASPAMLPSLVTRKDLGSANAHIQTGSILAGSFVGPALGGALYSVTTSLPFLAQSVSMLVSTFCLRRLPSRPPFPDRRQRTTVSDDIREGLRSVLNDRVLRSLAVSTGLLAFSTGMLQAVLVLHVVTNLRAPAQAYGALFTVSAAGSLVGTRATPKIRQTVGTRRCLLIAAALGSTSLVVIAYGPNVYIVGTGMLALGGGSMIYNITAVTLRQERTPDQLLGRVTSLSNLFGTGTIPLASLLAGGVTAATSTTTTLLIAAAICTTGLVWLAADMPARR